MDIRQALEAAQQSRPPARCKLVKLIDTIPADADGREDLVAAVSDREHWSSPLLAQVFASIGLDVSESLINNHRRGSCACRPA